MNDRSTGAPPPPFTGDAAYRVELKTSPARTQLWVFIGVLAAIVAGSLAIIAVRAFVRGRGQANVLVRDLHERMNHADWDGIYENADSAYRSETSASDSQILFLGISKKLGQVRDTKQQMTNVNVNTTGSFITASFETSFDTGARAVETVTWRSLGGSYHLHSYNIQSRAFLTR